jgi:hypothetical protein
MCGIILSVLVEFKRWIRRIKRDGLVLSDFLVWSDLKNKVQTLKVVQWTFNPRAWQWAELAFGCGISKFSRRLAAVTKFSGQRGK